MQKLLDQYRNAPTLANAKRIKAYFNKHMMAACLLTVDDSQLLADAVYQAKGE